MIGKKECDEVGSVRMIKRERETKQEGEREREKEEQRKREWEGVQRK